ncbi:cyclic lactone autoinducer peptide [Staphylococcus warneri]|nr:cyclic lactone autoinducer peptide [Staphylococcus warneri]AXZ22998.1 cyclic lactone autoinducer peptide [Staphylococcus warneri]KTW07436.1 accessory gene regulator AgrD [Staphylococcus warneri]OIS43321.1 accessory regulator AgrD [Staphylococcus warneri]OIS44037.1 accessory regulator AgrD [Staphylococcus warneri]PTI05251.1 cyclic lactone autoinducer peptide [Staphylococcus warneri]
MEFLVNLFFKFFTSILEFVGFVAGANPCAMFYDEPEVPSELTKLYE